MLARWCDRACRRSRCGWRTSRLARLPADGQVGEDRHLRRIPVVHVVRRELDSASAACRCRRRARPATPCTGCRLRARRCSSRDPGCRCRRRPGSAPDRRCRSPRSIRRRRSSSESPAATCCRPARRARDACRSATRACRCVASYASMKPRMPNSPPATPTMTLSFTTSGATVDRVAATCSRRASTSQTTAPVFMSSARRCASSVRHEQPVAEHAEAAIDRPAARPEVVGQLTAVAPDLPSGARVDRPRVAPAARDVQDAVDHERRRFESCRACRSGTSTADSSWPTFSGVICVSGLCRWPT